MTLFNNRGWGWCLSEMSVQFTAAVRRKRKHWVWIFHLRKDSDEEDSLDSFLRKKKHPISYQTSLLKYAARLFITWHIVTMLINLKCANCWNAWIFDASPWSCWLWQKTKISIKRKKKCVYCHFRRAAVYRSGQLGADIWKEFWKCYTCKEWFAVVSFFSLEIIFAASLWYFWASVNWPEWFSLSRG